MPHVHCWSTEGFFCTSPCSGTEVDGAGTTVSIAADCRDRRKEYLEGLTGNQLGLEVTYVMVSRNSSLNGTSPMPHTSTGNQKVPHTMCLSFAE